MKISFIIGNGFNYLIESIITQTTTENIPSSISTSKSEIGSKIREISSLWKKFDSLFNELKNHYQHVSDEELIKMIYAVLDFFSSIQLFEQIMGKQKIDEIKKTFNILLIDKIREIAEEFRIHENSEGYKDLKRFFPDFGDSFEKLINNNNITNCDIYNTNYDGIIDTLFTKGGSQHGFIGVDGFGSIPELPNYLKLYDKNLKNKIRRFHIHGSYKFEKKHGITYKTSKNTQNFDPVIIFNNPNLKEELISRDSVLSRYFIEIKKSMENSDKLIIFGNSMKSEPHLKKLIKHSFNKSSRKIYVCSRNPSQIKKEIEKNFNFEIFEKSTKNIDTIESLIAFIEEIIKH